MNKTTKLVQKLGTAKSVKPSPSKHEIIEALAIKRQGQLMQQEEERKVKLLSAENELNVAALQLVMEHGSYADAASIHHGYREDRENVASITITRTVTSSKIPASIQKLFKAVSKLETRINIPTVNELKREFREKMAGQTPKSARVSEMLKDPETSEFLESLLVQLSKPVQLSIQ